jgi:2,4-dihydroxyhept-2-ene-1,7-dioic acid aldolase
MKINKVKSLGSWITTYNPGVVDIMSSNHFKWLAIDLEHSTISLSEAEELIQIILKNKCTPYVRVGKNNELIIKKALDAGALGIIVPNIINSTDAKKAVNYSKYPPKGTRGVGLARAQLYGKNFKEYLKISKTIKLILQIENKSAIENLNSILSTKYIDGTIIGPYDLSASFNKMGKLNDNIVLKAINIYEKLSKKYNIPMGYHVVNLDHKFLIKKIKKNYQYLAYGTDMIFLEQSINKELKKIIN